MPSDAPPEKDLMMACGRISDGHPIKLVTGSKIAHSQSIAPDARNIPIAHSIAVRYGIIITAVEKPSFAPSVNTEYTGTFFKMAQKHTMATTRGIAQFDINVITSENVIYSPSYSSSAYLQT